MPVFWSVKDTSGKIYFFFNFGNKFNSKPYCLGKEYLQTCKLFLIIKAIVILTINPRLEVDLQMVSRSRDKFYEK